MRNDEYSEIVGFASLRVHRKETYVSPRGVASPVPGVFAGLRMDVVDIDYTVGDTEKLFRGEKQSPHT